MGLGPAIQSGRGSHSEKYFIPKYLRFPLPLSGHFNFELRACIVEYSPQDSETILEIREGFAFFPCNAFEIR
jgi:hypothetical protein